MAAIVVGSPNRLPGYSLNPAAALVSWSREFLMDPSPGCSALGAKDTTGGGSGTPLPERSSCDLSGGLPAWIIAPDLRQVWG